MVVKSEGLEDEKGKPIIRPYTPVSPSDKEGEFTFLVKKYPSGNMSKFIHEMKPGDTLSIKGPIPKWDYKGKLIGYLDIHLCVLTGHDSERIRRSWLGWWR